MCDICLNDAHPVNFSFDAIFHTWIRLKGAYPLHRAGRDPNISAFWSLMCCPDNTGHAGAY